MRFSEVRLQAVKNGAELYMLDLRSLADTVISFAPGDITLKEFVEAIALLGKETRIKDETLLHLKKVTEAVR